MRNERTLQDTDEQLSTKQQAVITPEELTSLIEAYMRSKGKEIKKTRKSGKCCRCSAKAEPGKRQLCSFHWNQFRYARSLLSPRERKTFTNAEVAAGRVGPSLRGKCRKRKNDYLEAS